MEILELLKTIGAIIAGPSIIMYILERKKYVLQNKQMSQDTTLKLYTYLENQNEKLMDQNAKLSTLVDTLHTKLEERDEEKRSFIKEVQQLREEIKQLKVKLQLFEKNIRP